MGGDVRAAHCTHGQNASAEKNDFLEVDLPQLSPCRTGEGANGITKQRPPRVQRRDRRGPEAAPIVQMSRDMDLDFHA